MSDEDSKKPVTTEDVQAVENDPQPVPEATTQEYDNKAFEITEEPASKQEEKVAEAPVEKAEERVQSVQNEIDPNLVNVIHGYDNKAFVLPDESAPKQRSDINVLSPEESASIQSFNISKVNRMELELRHGSFSIRSDLPNDPPRTPEVLPLRAIRLDRESVEIKYGFEFQTVRGHHFINRITEDHVAQKAGLKIGDLLREVNGESAESLTHQEVCGLIMADPLRVDLAVISRPELLLNFLEEDQKNFEEKKGTKNNNKKFRVHIKEDFEGFGFCVRNQKKRPFELVDLEQNSPAKDAGLKEGDLLVKADGIDLREIAINKLVIIMNKAVKRGYIDLEIGLPDETPVDVTQEVSVEQPRLCQIEANPGQKLGFSLTGARDTYKGVFKIKHIKEDSAANRAGLLEDDFILEVSGQSIVELTYDETMALIKQKQAENNLSLLVASRALWYRLHEIPVSIPKVVLPKFKRCHIQLEPGFQTFGFRLFSDPEIMPKHMVFKVEVDSPAFKAKLRDNDIIIQINKVNIRQKSPNKVGKLVNASLAREKIEMLVIDQAGYDFYKSKYKKMSKVEVNDSNVEAFYTDVESWVEDVEEEAETVVGNRVPTPPRLCKIEGEFADLGFSVSASKSTVGYFIISELNSGSHTEQAGILINDRILEVCGRPVENMSSPELVEFMEEKALEKDLSLLVINFRDYDWYMSKQNSDVETIPLPRLIHVKDFRLAPLIYSSTVNRGPFRVQKIEEDSEAAVRTGLLEGDYLIEVSGKNVESMEYAELVSLINEKQLDDQLQVLVVDKDTLVYYNSKNIPVTGDLLKERIDSVEVEAPVLNEAVFNSPPTETKRTVSFIAEVRDNGPVSHVRLNSVNYEDFKVKVNFEIGQLLGLSVEMTEGSIKSEKQKKKKKVSVQQVVTRIDPKSPAERAGLKKGDIILEINGHSTVGESKKKVVSWIRNSFRSIEFKVRRKVDMGLDDNNEEEEEEEDKLNVCDDDKENEERLNVEAKRLADKLISDSVNKLREDNGQTEAMSEA